MANIEWETRAKERSKTIKKKNKKIKELTTSRDGWKNKATDRKKIIEDLEKKIAIIKKNLNRITIL